MSKPSRSLLASWPCFCQKFEGKFDDWGHQWHCGLKILEAGIYMFSIPSAGSLEYISSPQRLFTAPHPCVDCPMSTRMRILGTLQATWSLPSGFKTLHKRQASESGARKILVSRSKSWHHLEILHTDSDWAVQMDRNTHEPLQTREKHRLPMHTPRKNTKHTLLFSSLSLQEILRFIPSDDSLSKELRNSWTGTNRFPIGTPNAQGFDSICTAIGCHHQCASSGLISFYCANWEQFWIFLHGGEVSP